MACREHGNRLNPFDADASGAEQAIQVRQVAQYRNLLFDLLLDLVDAEPHGSSAAVGHGYGGACLLAIDRWRLQPVAEVDSIGVGCGVGHIQFQADGFPVAGHIRGHLATDADRCVVARNLLGHPHQRCPLVADDKFRLRDHLDPARLLQSAQQGLQFFRSHRCRLLVAKDLLHFTGIVRHLEDRHFHENLGVPQLPHRVEALADPGQRSYFVDDQQRFAGREVFQRPTYTVRGPGIHVHGGEDLLLHSLDAGVGVGRRRRLHRSIIARFGQR